MSLLITIVKAPDSVAVAESTKTFDMQGGTIGRGKDNAWVLDDPERFLSTRHCQFSCEGGQFYITDLSTNGTFYNGAPHPIGKGSRLPVNDGDSFTVGDYEFSISAAAGAMSQSAPLSDPFGSSNMGSGSAIPEDDLFSAPSGNSEFSSNPFSGGHVSSSEPLFSTNPEETDPLAALDKLQGGQQNSLDNIAGGFANTDPFKSNDASDPFGGPTHSDQADPLSQQVSWPDSQPESPDPFSGGGIPDDWDDDLMSSGAAPQQPVAPQPVPQQPVAPQPVAPQAPVQPSMPLTQPPVVPKPAAATTPQLAPETEAPANNQQAFANQAPQATSAQQQALEAANTKIQAELELLKKQINTQQRGVNTETTVDTVLIDALGFQGQNLGDAEITQINQLAGEVLREMVSGLMQVLGSRSTIKNEFRMNVTTIQPVENNPLKFSANVDDALENMFIKSGNAYKKPLEAVREGFEGVAEHQVAILAGLRSAFKGVIERFDPNLLEARFAKQNKGGLIPGSQKAKNWDLYLEYYNELAGDIDNSFQYLFGDEFVQAYEDQLQKLAVARKNKNMKPAE